MATTQPNIFIQTFEKIVRHLAQQEVTRLRPHVTERSAQSVNHNWERLGVSDATPKTLRLTQTPAVGNTPNASTGWDRRVSIAETWHNGDSTEQEDPSQMLVDPNSKFTPYAAVWQLIAVHMTHWTGEVLVCSASFRGL